MVFPSVYDMTNESMTTVRKQHFWEYFSGATLNSRWTTNNIQGTTFAMTDEVDGGFKILTGATSGDAGAIQFNNKRQYEETGCVSISVWKNSSTASIISKCGFSSELDVFAGSYALCGIQSGASFFDLRTRDGSTASGANSSIFADTSYHAFKIECDASNVVLSIDGVTEVTDTTNLPIIPLQPAFYVSIPTTASKSIQTKYVECYNT
jgi:hypothetical protein